MTDHKLEVTKCILLSELDPMALLALRRQGECEFSFRESLFNADFPGHYCRRIKSIALTIDAANGQPFDCTLTQLQDHVVWTPDPVAIQALHNSSDSRWRVAYSDREKTKLMQDGNIHPSLMEVLATLRRAKALSYVSMMTSFCPMRVAALFQAGT